MVQRDLARLMVVLTAAQSLTAGVPAVTAESSFDRLRSAFRQSASAPAAITPHALRAQDVAHQWRQAMTSARRSVRRNRRHWHDPALAARHAKELESMLLPAATQVDAYFAGLESELRADGLEAKIPLLRETRRQVSAKSGELLQAIRSMGISEGAPAAVEKALAEDGIQPAYGVAGPAPRAMPSPMKVRPEVAVRAAARAADTTPPGPEHLAESTFIRLSPAVRALAAQLNNSPAAIYEYVYNRVQLTPYYGMVQDSAAVLASSSGNPAEQATLLVALLRAAGIPARYSSGSATVPLADAQRWLGVRSPEAVTATLSYMTTSAISGSRVAFIQIWAQAWIDNGDSGRWVDLDPSYKLQQLDDGVRIEPPPFDRIHYLQTQADRPAAEVYVGQILEAIQSAAPGKGISDAGVRATPAQDTSGVLPSQLPYTTASDAAPFTEIADNAAYRVRLILRDRSSHSVLLSRDLSVPSTAMQSVVYGWTPATDADARLIQKYGGLPNAPAFLVRLKMQLLIDGVPLDSSDLTIAPGSDLDVDVGYLLPGRDTSTVQKAVHTFTAGGMLAICLDAQQINESFLSARLHNYQQQIARRTSSVADALTGEMLSLAGWHYFSKTRSQGQMLARPLGLRAWTPGISEGATIMGNTVTDLYGKPLLITPASTVVDVKNLALQLDDLTTPGSDRVTLARRIFGMSSSSMEHELWEELLFTRSLSTIKGLQIAYKTNTPVLTVNSGNASSQLPQIASASIRAEIQQRVADGAEVLIPARPVTLNQWSGYVWIEESSNGGFGYILGRLNGGESTLPNSWSNPPPPIGWNGEAGITGGMACGLPVTLSSGNMYHEFADIAIADPVLPLQLVRTYNSQSTAGGAFGYGWSHNYMVSLREAPEGVYYTAESGGVYLFTKTASGYTPPPFFFGQLTKDAQGFGLRSKDGRTYRFTTAGVAQTITDRNGNQTKFDYDSAGNLSAVTAPSGRQLKFEYGTARRISAVTDHSGRRWLYAYDTAGNLIASTDAVGNRMQYAYYSQGSLRGLRSVVYPEGDHMDFEYFANNKVSRTVDRGGSEMRFYYLPLRNTTVLVDERGLATTYEYNSAGNIVRIAKPDGNIVTQEWNNAAKMTRRVDETGSATTWQYDRQGNLTAVTDPLGNRSALTYDATFSLPVSATDALGNTTRMTYDANGNLTKATDAAGNARVFTYDAAGHMLTSTDAEGGTTTMTWASGGLATIKSPGESLTTFTYDAAGRQASIRNALGAQSSFAYDAQNRLTSATDMATAVTTYQYDRDGRMIAAKDPLGRVTRYEFEPGGKLTRTVDGRGNAAAMSYLLRDCSCASVSPAVASFTDPNGGVWSFDWDYRTHMTGHTDPNGNTVRMSYDAASRIVRRTYADGGSVNYEYDAAHQLVKRSYSDGKMDRFEYNAAGDMTAARNDAAEVTMTYDALRRVVKVADSRYATPIEYKRDKTGRITSVSAPNGRIYTYTYDSAGRLAKLAGDNGQSAAIDYDEMDRRKQVRFSNGSNAAYTYDAVGRVATLRHTGAKGDVLASFSYTYDAPGNPTRITDAAGDHNFAYDEMNQLLSASHPNQPGENYTYDAASNRGGYTYDAAQQMTSANGAAFTYDTRGNLASRTDANGTTTYNYDLENRLTGAQLPGGSTTAYRYDALGRRVQKSVGGNATNYVYDGANLLMDEGPGGTHNYAASRLVDDLLFFSAGSAAYFAHADALGTVAAVSGSDGTVAQTYAYSAFGVPMGTDAPLLTTWRFTAREWDVETGLYHYRARAYDPATGRFLQRDPLWQLGNGADFNRYGYANANPLRYTDPTGMCSSTGGSLIGTGLMDAAMGLTGAVIATVGIGAGAAASTTVAGAVIGIPTIAASAWLMKESTQVTGLGLAEMSAGWQMVKDDISARIDPAWQAVTHPMDWLGRKYDEAAKINDDWSGGGGDGGVRE